ncbi:MAG: hypothetical protein ACTHZ5_09745 [Micrococcaceae bacterium]
MYVSVEVLTVVISAVALMIALGTSVVAGFAWLIKRMDQNFEQLDVRFDKVDQRIEGLHSELTEVKIAVARLEGPQRRIEIAR